MASPVDFEIFHIVTIGATPSPRDPGRVSGGGHPAHGAKKAMSRDPKLVN
jgi:hypothetical protein